MVESNTVSVLRNSIPLNYKYIQPIKFNKNGVAEVDRTNEVFWDSVKEALLALRQKEILLSKAKSRIEILDKEKVEFLDNTKGREFYTTMNRQERAIWKEVCEVISM